MLNAPRRATGVSLIELMIAIAILTIVMAIGFPSFQVWMQNLQVRSGSESMLNGMEYAKQEAIKRNAPVTFTLSDGTGLSDWNVACAAPFSVGCPNAAILRSAVSAEGATNARVGVNAIAAALQNYAAALPVASNMPATITFDSFGRVIGAASFTRIDTQILPAIAVAGARRLVITITPGGATRLCDPQFALANNPQGCV